MPHIVSNAKRDINTGKGVKKERISLAGNFHTYICARLSVCHEEKLVDGRCCLLSSHSFFTFQI